jgi:hypothetical protein
VVAGAVKIVLPSAEDGEPAIMATLTPGDFFGALALLDDPRSATAVALGKTGRWSSDGRRSSISSTATDRCGSRSWRPSPRIARSAAHVQDLHFLDLPVGWRSGSCARRPTRPRRRTAASGPVALCQSGGGMIGSSRGP